MVGLCPIAYVGVDGRIHLTNVEGTIDIELEGPSADGRIWFIGSPPAWSPDGGMIAYMHERRSDARRIAVTEPGTGTHWQLGSERGNAYFGGWMRDGILHEAHVGFRDARLGTRLPVPRAPGLDIQYSRQVGPTSRRLGGSCISVGPKGVDLRDDDFQVVQSMVENSDPRLRAWVPRVDKTGTWMAWTAPEFKEPRYGRLIGVARVDRGPTVQSWFVGADFGDCVFCDWTDDGNILANVREQTQPRQRGWCLAILDKEGKLLRRIPTDVPPAPESGASWRHARH